MIDVFSGTNEMKIFFHSKNKMLFYFLQCDNLSVLFSPFLFSWTFL